MVHKVLHDGAPVNYWVLSYHCPHYSYGVRHSGLLVIPKNHQKDNGVHVCSYMVCLCCCSLAQSCLILCDPMDCGMPGFPVHHQLPQLARTHVH